MRHNLLLFPKTPTFTITYLYSHNFHTCLYNSTHEDIFAAASQMRQNLSQKKKIPTVTIYTPTHTHASHSIIRFNVQQHFRTILSQFKNILHHRFQIPMYAYTLGVLFYHQRGLFLYSFLVILNILLNFSLYDQTFQFLTATIANRFT